MKFILIIGTLLLLGCRTALIETYFYSISFDPQFCHIIKQTETNIELVCQREKEKYAK